VLPLAGAKYALLGRAYQGFYDAQRRPREDLGAFHAFGIDAAVF